MLMSKDEQADLGESGDAQSTLMASFERLNDQGKVFYEAFYADFIARDKRIETLMKNVSEERRHRILAQSLTYSVLLSNSSYTTEEFDNLKRWHGPSGMGITIDMLDGWRRAFLAQLPLHDPRVDQMVVHAWELATLYLIQRFNTD